MIAKKKILFGCAGAMFLALGTTESAQAITIFRGTGDEAANQFSAMQAAIGGANVEFTQKELIGENFYV